MENSTAVTAPRTAAKSIVSPTWEELLGSTNWEGLVEPGLEDNLRKFILQCGDLCQATYDCFNSNSISPQCGNSRHGKDTFFHDVMLENASRYQVVSFLYATSGSRSFFKHYFHLNDGLDSWDRVSNWMGYVAVTTDEFSKANGRREIYVAWRGTITSSEWWSNIAGVVVPPVSAEPLFFDPTSTKVKPLFFWEAEPKIHEGWLSIYDSDNSTSDYVKTSARYQLITTIRNLREKYKNEKLSIVVTGHSLGGALATVSAFDLVQNNVAGDDVLVSAFVFACPQVGNPVLKTRMEKHSNLKIFHVKNVHDIVPRVVGSLLWFYVPLVTTELEVDTKKSPHLKGCSISDAHNLQATLHAVAGWNGRDSQFELKVKRSLALVNKSCGLLREESRVPECWRVEKNKGMVFNDKTGEWVLDPPPSPNKMLFNKLSIN
ncbi:phospholipase A1-IIdelta-like [Humulus lupulus]|uniref:phospholipase A1-IIdelta-like n=1 Tax=Humulus lupulus TaxID=3486 RepID=UPI002B41346A|nr:phospholipase A1-IIdelta-like [Humulus lupulus]